MEESGKNRTPDKLPPEEREELFACCNRALDNVIEQLDPEYLIGIGKFAEKQLKQTEFADTKRIDFILHPSPASPAANRGWAEQAEKQLQAIGISL